MKLSLFVVVLTVSLCDAQPTIMSTGDTTFIYQNTWIARDKIAIEWMAFEEILIRASGDTIPYLTSPQEVVLWKYDPIAVIKEVRFFEFDSLNINLGIRRILIGARFTGRTDDNHFLIYDEHCDTTNSKGIVYGTRDNGKALCSDHISSPGIQIDLIDSLINIPSFIDKLEHKDINSLPMTYGRIYIKGRSMEPFLLDGSGYQYTVVNDETILKVGDIVAYINRQEIHIKRIAAIPGQILKGFVLPPTVARVDIVPDNQYYLTADNSREFSASETHGLVSHGNIIAKVVVSK
jgi:hypothetical protein